MYLIIDNYDSFTYNLFQYIQEMSDEEVRVFRNDRITIPEIERLNPKAIIISPGPGRPEEAGLSVSVVRHFAGKIPILGVCLGHQAIGYAFGASIIGAKNIVHGKTEGMTLDGMGVFRNIPSPSRFTRYHSLVISRKGLSPELEVTATSDDGEIMGIRHKLYTIEGIQFHPESVASEYGKKLLKNFLNYRRKPFNISEILTKITSGKELSDEEAHNFMEELTDGELTDAQSAAVLTALAARKVSAREIAAFASVLRKRKKSISHSYPLLDTCGTGGDGKGSFNISSMAAILACSCGAYIAKHGNRGISSRSGSADFYHELGIVTNLSPKKASLLLDKTGFTFLFAPIYHESMKHVARVRRELGIKTVMNLMGPLLNPADAAYQLIGVYSEELCTPMAEALSLLGKERVMVVHGLDGLDEISVSAATRIIEIDKRGNVRDYILNPEDLGIKRFHQSEIAGGTPKENVSIAYDLFNSKGREAIKEAVLLNAGAALYIYNLSESIREGYLLAKRALESGKTEEKLTQIIDEGKRILEG